jgi:hypothetical protein
VLWANKLFLNRMLVNKLNCFWIHTPMLRIMIISQMRWWWWDSRNDDEALTPTNECLLCLISPSMSRGTLAQPLSTLSTKTRAYPFGTGWPWIIGVLV